MNFRSRETYSMNSLVMQQDEISLIFLFTCLRVNCFHCLLVSCGESILFPPAFSSSSQHFPFIFLSLSFLSRLVKSFRRDTHSEPLYLIVRSIRTKYKQKETRTLSERARARGNTCVVDCVMHCVLSFSRSL